MPLVRRTMCSPTERGIVSMYIRIMTKLALPSILATTSVSMTIMTGASSRKSIPIGPSIAQVSRYMWQPLSMRGRTTSSIPSLPTRKCWPSCVMPIIKWLQRRNSSLMSLVSAQRPSRCLTDCGMVVSPSV